LKTYIHIIIKYNTQIDIHSDIVTHGDSDSHTDTVIVILQLVVIFIVMLT